LPTSTIFVNGVVTQPEIPEDERPDNLKGNNLTGKILEGKSRMGMWSAPAPAHFFPTRLPSGPRFTPTAGVDAPIISSLVRGHPLIRIMGQHGKT